jgi:hypothetical protein
VKTCNLHGYLHKSELIEKYPTISMDLAKN